MFNSDLDKEIHLLLSMGGNIKLKSIRLFWKEHSSEMPLLGRLAQRVLAIPMTSKKREKFLTLWESLQLQTIKYFTKQC